MKASVFTLTAAVVAVCHLLFGSVHAGSNLFYEEAPFYYSDSEPTDPVADLIKKIDAGDVCLDNASEKGFLGSLLAKLAVPIESQVLVYSKTSLQNEHILPARPRALYFSEDYYVGWVQGGDIEVISIDPKLGPVFYLLKVPKSPEDKPQLIRSAECMNCHGGSRTGGVPGMLVRSVRSDARGFPILSAGTSQTDHSSPISERWGGWYVTGASGGEKHMGNLLFQKDETGSATIIRDHGTLENLDSAINRSPYLANTSDIVALMVLEHQITVHNALTKASFNTRRWLHYDTMLADYLNETDGKLREQTLELIEREAEQLLEVMFFKDEFELESWGVEGSESFQEAFGADGPRSIKGSSLKDFELLSRLFRHRFSYMVYSHSFDYLPKQFKGVFYDKLSDILHGGHRNFDYLGGKERERILAILRETKPDFAAHDAKGKHPSP